MTYAKKYASIRDVAKRAGVSAATVSRALNSPQHVTDKTRMKVLKAVDECHYVPNKNALNVFSGNSKTIAFFMAEITNPFYSVLLKSFNDIIFEMGYNLIVCETAYSRERELKYFEYCKSIRVCGIIYTAGTMEVSIKHAPFPIVFIDQDAYSNTAAYSLKSDNDKALQLLVSYLFRLNHRKIGFIGGPSQILSVKERCDSFLKYTSKYGLEAPEEYIFTTSFNEEGGVKAFDYFYSLPVPPTAVIAASDQIAHGFIMRANSLGVNIPQDFSVCGIDDVDPHFYPKVTSIQQNIDLLARTAFDFICNPGTSRPKNTIIDVSLSIGQTCRKLSGPDHMNT